VEVPSLSVSTIWNLDDHVSVVDQVEVSVAVESSDNVEVSFNIKSELLVELTLGWLLLVVAHVYDLPFLVGLSVSWFDDDVSVLVIKSTLDCNNLTLGVDNEVVLISEDLPPS
jgi:hypothetical protein